MMEVGCQYLSEVRCGDISRKIPCWTWLLNQADLRSGFGLNELLGMWRNAVNDILVNSGQCGVIQAHGKKVFLC